MDGEDCFKLVLEELKEQIEEVARLRKENSDYFNAIKQLRAEVEALKRQIQGLSK